MLLPYSLVCLHWAFYFKLYTMFKIKRVPEEVILQMNHAKVGMILDIQGERFEITGFRKRPWGNNTYEYVGIGVKVSDNKIHDLFLCKHFLEYLITKHIVLIHDGEEVQPS
jgi:hypothetical protein